MSIFRDLFKADTTQVFDFIHTRSFRMLACLLLAFALCAGVFAIAPHQLPVSLYKLSLVMLGAYAAYWLDRWLFPYARPDVFLERVKPVADKSRNDELQWLGIAGQAMLRRAIIVAAVVVAVGLGA